MKVPFFRPELTDEEIREVVATLESGWLTTGPRTRRFESEFAAAVGAEHAVAVNSCTAAMHLATVAKDLKAGQAVLVPTMTFAASAEVIRYAGAVPVLVDCDPVTLSMDLADAESKLDDLRSGRLPAELDPGLDPVGIVPVHVAGLMLDIDAVRAFARKHGLWTVEDAAHAFPSAWRPTADAAWRRCGENTADVTCFSFYANKTLTTGEGGMAVTDDAELAAEMRSLSLHGLSNDAWGRYESKGSWDYRILAPGYKYNLTDIASALGLRQLERAEPMRRDRERIAHRFTEAFSSLDTVETPPDPPDRIHSWHLYQLRLHLERLTIDRDTFLQAMRDRGVGFSVHWRPLHLHPYYEQSFGWRPEHLPNATDVWRRTVSLPIFPAMSEAEIDTVITVVSELCAEHAR